MAISKKNPSEQTDILLESGTNELEVLVFGLGSGTFGVNVAKVREVIMPTAVSAAPDQPEAVTGMFNLRGRMLPLIDLHHYLDFAPRDDDVKNRRIIVMEFNGQQSAFQVDTVERIHRMSWSDMKSVPDSGGKQPFCITGITEIDDRLILMLDFESIVDHINYTDEYHIDSVENTLGVDRASHQVIIAEDSNFIRGIMMRVLTQSGYTNTKEFNNGLHAWQYLQQQVALEDIAASVVVTDIEMPLMDGLALTKNIKNDNSLSHLPVLLFSSLITEDTIHKGKQVRADEQIAKPQLPDLVQYVDKWVSGNGQTKAAA